MIADGFPEVTVLFADLVDFTRRSDRSSPNGVVQVLDDLFSALDRLAERHGLEKIKTIGDAYMVVGGLPEPRPDHAQAVAEMALALREEVLRHHDPDGQPLAVRVGIDTGPVVAGVIGRRKFSYDLWGDTVNTASRMDRRGVAGCIQDGTDLSAAPGPVPLRAARTDPGQGQGAAGHLVPGRPGCQPR